MSVATTFIIYSRAIHTAIDIYSQVYEQVSKHVHWTKHDNFTAAQLLLTASYIINSLSHEKIILNFNTPLRNWKLKPWLLAFYRVHFSNSSLPRSLFVIKQWRLYQLAMRLSTWNPLYWFTSSNHSLSHTARQIKLGWKSSLLNLTKRCYGKLTNRTAILRLAARCKNSPRSDTFHLFQTAIDRNISCNYCAMTSQSRFLSIAQQKSAMFCHNFNNSKQDDCKLL